MRFRTGEMGRVRGRRAIVAGLIIVFTGLAIACDGSPTDTTDALDQSTASAEAEADLSVVFGDLTDGLGLSDDQIEAVRSILEEYRGQGRQSGALWYAAAELQDVLSSEQIEALVARQAELRAEARAGRGEMGGRFRDRSERAGGFRGQGPGAGPGRGGIHGEGLDLSDAQIEEIELIRESFGPQLDDIREGVRAGIITREEAKTRMDEIREAMHEALAGVLTEEQLSLLEEHRAEAETRREEMRSQWEEGREAVHAAMADALGLTDEQVAALEALRVESEEQGRPSPEEAEARREDRRQALLDVLDDRQEEIWSLHGALAQVFARHQARGREADGSGRGGRQGRRGQGGFGRSV
jgi:hypothetical protein